jgi:hypothetical protein
MFIKDSAINKSPKAAEGRVRIELTNPATGKVTECVEGNNHVFVEPLLYQENNMYNISTPFLMEGYGVNAINMCLNDDGTAIDTRFPYLRGHTVGYGTPGQGSSGLYRGAYNAANQVLMDWKSDFTRVRYKHQYDFTPSQANGTIRNVGLTHQYTNKRFHSRHGLSTSTIPLSHGDQAYTNDGRYQYDCSTAGVITIKDKYLRTTATVDVSATVGTTATTYKRIGYAPRTGRYYVWCGSSTAGNRKMYEYSNNAFTTLLNTYSPSNIAILASGSSNSGIYIYGNNMYFGSAQNQIQKADFVANTALTTITITDNTNIIASTATDAGTGSIADSYGIYYADFSVAIQRGIIFSPDTDSVMAFFVPGTLLNYSTGLFFNPFIRDYNILSAIYSYAGNGYSLMNMGAAATTYILPSPLTKTSANGLTATYELIFYW